jgi:hypothetical protein
MIRPLVQALLVVVVAGAGCAHWPWESHTGHIARSKRFTAYIPGDLTPGATLAALEQASAVLESSLFKNRTISPVEVLLLDWPEFRQALGAQRTGASCAELPGKGALARHGLIVMYGLDTTSAGAMHRLTHLFLHAAAPRAPLWLHEGLASHLERATYREGEPEGTACLGQAPQKQAELPLVELFAWSWAAFDDTSMKESKRLSAYRFTASNLVDYLLMGDGGKLRDKFSELVDALAEGAAAEAALTKVYPGLTTAALQEKVSEHRRTAEGSARGACPISFVVPSENFTDSAKAKLVPAPEGQIDELLARVRMLPRREGLVDWFPPSMLGVDGGQFAPPTAATPPAKGKPAPAAPAAPAPVKGKR